MTGLNTETQQAIAADTGIPFDEIADMDWDEIDRRIEQKTGKKLTFHPCDDPRRSTRGSVLLGFKRLLLPETVESRIANMDAQLGVSK
jgi:hypothetical protein